MLKTNFINKKALPLPETVDFYFLFLRLFTIVGGLAWYLMVSHAEGQKEVLGWLLSLYTIYSCLLYAGIFRWPQAIRGFYVTTLGVDLIFVFILIRYVGELRGSFFIAFYLLVAIHSFYFGLRVALATALISSLLYAKIYLDLAGLAVIPWPDFVLRIAFLFLIALSLGLLAEREKLMRKKVEELNRDLTRKNSILEETYRHLSIGKLIGDIAEGINGPCGIMATRSELLLKEARENGFTKEFTKGLEVINKCSHQVAQVIKSLLTFSKQKAFEMKPLDLNQLVEETLLLMERELKERGVRVKKYLVSGLPPILGDAYELKGVLINLISNGMDALPTGGTIGIATQMSPQDGGEILCTIADNGVGIPEENLERIFNPFFTTKHSLEGIGLGLSTSLSVMKKHNGSIGVKSRRGEGSAFTLSLPSYRPATSAP